MREEGRGGVPTLVNARWSIVRSPRIPAEAGRRRAGFRRAMLDRAQGAKYRLAWIGERVSRRAMATRRRLINPAQSKDPEIQASVDS